jgi:hypothetical protein
MIYKSDLLVGRLYTVKLVEKDNKSALIIWIPSYSTNDFVCSVVKLEEYNVLASIIEPPSFDNQFNVVYIGENKNIKLSKNWPYSFITSSMTKINVSRQGLIHLYTL